MPCYVDPPSCTESEWLTKMLRDAISLLSASDLEKILCQVCRLLTPNQMYVIDGLDIYIGLYQWYRQHLLYDFSANFENPEERKRCEEEAMRCGWTLQKEDPGFSIKDSRNRIIS